MPCEHVASNELALRLFAWQRRFALSAPPLHKRQRDGSDRGVLFLGGTGTYFLQGVEQERKSYSKCVLKLYLVFFLKICILHCLCSFVDVINFYLLNSF